MNRPYATGARNGVPRGLLRFLARVLPPQLDAFVLPGMDVARARGLNIEAAGLRPVATPRHAAVLLLVGELPEELWDAATVVYAQMPRPRAIVALGTESIGPLPGPDASAATSQEGLEAASEHVRDLLRAGSWSEKTEPFEAPALLPKRRRKRKKKKEKPEETGDGNREKHNDKSKQGGMQHGGMGGGSDMDMGFMSMVRLTEHLPKGADGLPMERVKTPFGPFFPGLSSGLVLTLWLDGDTVARADAAPHALAGASVLDISAGMGDLAERLARHDPLAPASYRRLAEAAGAAAPSGRGSFPTELGPVAALELERAASHLNWLAGFGHLLGYVWLARKASAWQLKLRSCPDVDHLASLEPELLNVLRRVQRTPLLSRRLTGIGVLGRDDLDGVGGPVARASGLHRDARLDDPSYRSFAFEPVVRTEGDALARLSVRLEEIRRSVALALAAHRSNGRGGSADPQAPAARVENSSAPGARLETPRGAASLRLRTNDDGIAEAVLETPSTTLIPLVEQVTVGLELADALVAVASLDISPWEVVQ